MPKRKWKIRIFKNVCTHIVLLLLQKAEDEKKNPNRNRTDLILNACYTVCSKRGPPMPMPYRIVSATTHTVSFLSNKHYRFVLYIPSDLLCTVCETVFLLISHIEWPICTWICRKINKDSVWRGCCCRLCHCCRYYCAESSHRCTLYAFHFAQFIHTLERGGHLCKRYFHCIKPIFRFQSLKSSVLRTSDVFVLFFFSFVWLKGQYY